MFQRSFFALGALLLALASPSVAPASDTVSRMCHRNDDFTILENANEGVGATFTIRKTTPSFKADCTFEERPTDTVIGQNGNDDAFYYIALRGDHLILDEGTSPDRWARGLRCAIRAANSRCAVLDTAGKLPAQLRRVG
jgi:hypothetical protein